MKRLALTVVFTPAQANALRALANCGLEHIQGMAPASREAGRRGITKIIETLGLSAHRYHGAIHGRRQTHH